MAFRILVALTLCALLSPVHAAPVLGGYVPTWRAVTDAQLARCTHVYHCFLLYNEDGTAARTQKMPDPQLVDRIHAAKAKALLSIGGGGYHGFPALLKDPQRRQRVIRSTLDIVRSAGYDGIDVDWEFPDNAETADLWKHFIEDLRKELDAISKERRQPVLLTAAVNASHWAGQWLDASTINTHLDYLNVMSYDFSGPWGGRVGPHANLHPVTRVPGRANNVTPSGISVAGSMHYWHNTRGVHKNKLVVGLPFYSYLFQNVSPWESLTENHGKTVQSASWATLSKRVQEENWLSFWDPQSHCRWYATPDGKNLVVLDDPDVLETKTRWARHQGYLGVFIWELGQDAPGAPLLDRVHRTLQESAKPQNAP